MDDLADKNRPLAGQEPSIAQEHSKDGAAWVYIAGFIILLLLLAIFILQNSQQVKISFLGFQGNLSFAVGLLLAAVAGALLTLIVGSIRILQLKSKNRR